jgi:hypothetical protein
LFGLFKPNIERLQAKGNVEGLVKALHHKDFGIRRDAATALGQIDASSAEEPLIAILRADRHYWVRRAAAEALGQIGSIRATGALTAAMDGDSEDAVRRAAAHALDLIKEKVDRDKEMRMMEAKLISLARAYDERDAWTRNSYYSPGLYRDRLLDAEKQIARLEPEVKQIGEILNRRGGYDEMVACFQAIEGMPGARMVEWLWNGIGEWRG